MVAAFGGYFLAVFIFLEIFANVCSLDCSINSYRYFLFEKGSAFLKFSIDLVVRFVFFNSAFMEQM